MLQPAAFGDDRRMLNGLLVLFGPDVDTVEKDAMRLQRFCNTS
jgi:hypothetical protein